MLTVGERWVGEVARWRAVLVQWRAMLEPGWRVGGGSTTLWWWWKTKDLPRRGVDRWRRGGYLGDASLPTTSFRPLERRCKTTPAVPLRSFGGLGAWRCVTQPYVTSYDTTFELCCSLQ